MPTYTMGQNENEKKHAACDECRNRKLKCSRDFPICSRCREENIGCIYSPQKRMGRPRKRARNEDQVPDLDDVLTTTTISNSDGTGFTLPDSSDGEPSFNIDLTEVDSTSFNLHQGSQLSLDQHFIPHDPTLQITTPPTDPIFQLSNNIVPNLPCACLSNMYLVLSGLQSQQTFDFPSSLPTLRGAVRTTKDVLQCEQCPRQTSSAMQNMMLLTTLLTSITDCYRKLLHSIDTEAGLSTASGAKKPFRVGDNSPEHAHLHTGTLDCPMGFNIELEGDEWRMLARKVVKADVDGKGSGGNGDSVLGLADLLEERQIKWHSNPEMMMKMQQHFVNGACEECVPREGEFSCLKMINMVRQHVALLRL